MQIVAPRPAQTAPMNPLEFPNLAAWFDALDTSSMLTGAGATITDGGSVALWADKSGNSGVNCLVAPGGALNNEATIPTIGALGTTDFTIVATVRIFAQVATYDQALVSVPNATNGFTFAVRGGLRRLVAGKIGVGYNSSVSQTDITLDTWITVGYRRSGTTATYFLGGVPDGTATDNYDYTASAALGFLVSSTNYTSTRHMRSVRIYSAALSDAEVLADYNGTVQANCIVNIDFSTAGKKLANGDTFTCATGQTVTLNSSGATGARIAGERDLFQGTAANRPIYLAYSGTKYGYLNGTAGNYFSTPAMTAFGTGDFSVSARVMATTFASTARAVVGGAANAFGIRFEVATGKLVVVKVGVASLTASTSAATALQTVVIGYTRSGTTGTYYIDGVAAGTVTDTNDYTVGVSEVGSLVGGTNSLLDGRVFWARIYNAALDGTAMAADAAGTVQANIVADFNPALYTSGTTFTASTGEVWTINGGAHIVTRTGLYFDGSNDYLKTAAFSLSQPETVYFVGSQVSWTAADAFFEGNSGTERMKLGQITSSPTIALYAGTADAASNGDLALQTGACVASVFSGASSALRVNRGTATTGNPGTQSANGFTAGARYDGAQPANVFVSEIPVYAAAHDTATQNRMALYAGRKHGFAV